MNRNPKKITFDVICPVCTNIQSETRPEGDKYAWLCKRCEAVIEGNEPHILQEKARFIARVGGNVCTGFGGMRGQIFHKVYKRIRNG